MLVWVPFRAAAATRLSCPGQGISRRFGWFQALARLSLVTAALSMLSGCLVDDPPPYAAPKKTRPRLEYAKALPSLKQVIVANSGDLVKFEVPVTSEDVGQELYALLFLDEVLATLPGRLPASTLDDPNERKVSLTWGVPSKDAVKPGCHRMVLRVTHFSNIIPGKSNELFDKDDLDEVYWFANLNVTPENANSLVSCPQAGVGGP
jgi:hypothetical protein